MSKKITLKDRWIKAKENLKSTYDSVNTCWKSNVSPKWKEIWKKWKPIGWAIGTLFALVGFLEADIFGQTFQGLVRLIICISAAGIILYLLFFGINPFTKDSKNFWKVALYLVLVIVILLFSILWIKNMTVISWCCGSTITPSPTGTISSPTGTISSPTPTDTPSPSPDGTPPSHTPTDTLIPITIPVTPGTPIPTAHKEIDSITNENDLCDYLIWPLNENFGEDSTRYDWSSVVDFSFLEGSNLLSLGTVNGAVGFYDFLSGDKNLKADVTVDTDILLRITELEMSWNNRFVYFSPYASYIYKGSVENYSLYGKPKRTPIPGKNSKVLDFVLHDDLIFLSTENGEILIIDNNINEVLRTQEGNYVNKPINSLAITDDGKYLISGGSDNTFRIWETDDKPPYLNIKERIEVFDRVNAVSASKLDSGYIFVIGTDKGNLYLADEKAKELKDLHKLSPGFDAIWSVAISNNSELLAAGTQTGHLLIYKLDELINSLKDGEVIQEPYVYLISQLDENTKTRLNSLSFSIDNNYLAIGSLKYITIKGFCPSFSEN